MRPLDNLDLENIDECARAKGFAHPADTIRLVAAVREAREELAAARAALKAQIRNAMIVDGEYIAAIHKSV